MVCKHRSDLCLFYMTKSGFVILTINGPKVAQGSFLWAEEITIW